MKAARLVFSRKGFEETSVEDICLAAGYSKGGFYFHFRSKQQLLLELLEDARGLEESKTSDCLALEVWALAGWNEQLRELIAGPRGDRPENGQEAITNGADVASSNTIDLLPMLELGLRVQRQFLPEEATAAGTLLHSQAERFRGSRDSPVRKHHAS
jgi:AcrR family transcriptional regulator